MHPLVDVLAQRGDPRLADTKPSHPNSPALVMQSTRPSGPTDTTSDDLAEPRAPATVSTLGARRVRGWTTARSPR